MQPATRPAADSADAETAAIIARIAATRTPDRDMTRLTPQMIWAAIADAVAAAPAPTTEEAEQIARWLGYR